METKQMENEMSEMELIELQNLQYYIGKIDKRLSKMKPYQLETLLWLLSLRENLHYSSIEEMKNDFYNVDGSINRDRVDCPYNDINKYFNNCRVVVVFRVLFFDDYKKLWKRKQNEIDDVRRVEENRIMRGYKQLIEKNRHVFRMYSHVQPIENWDEVIKSIVWNK